MQTYRTFRPFHFDTAGLGLEDRQDWFVVEVVQNRDSGCLDRCNFQCAKEAIEAVAGEDESVEVHRFGHWANGWFEIILVKPGSKAALEAEEIEAALADYPILDEAKYGEMLREEADRVWRDCYSTKNRLDYYAKHSQDFKFNCFSDMLGCMRGKYFAGDATLLVESHL